MYTLFHHYLYRSLVVSAYGLQHIQTRNGIGRNAEATIPQQALGIYQAAVGREHAHLNLPCRGTSECEWQSLASPHLGIGSLQAKGCALLLVGQLTVNACHEVVVRDGACIVEPFQLLVARHICVVEHLEPVVVMSLALSLASIDVIGVANHSEQHLVGWGIIITSPSPITGSE